MISFLHGVLAAKHPDRVELDVNGVGYEVFITQRTQTTLPPLGQELLLKTYLHVREDIQQLYGFPTDQEKQAFLLALSVSGVGPRAALSLLSALDPGSFFQAVLANDLARLKAVPGIGQKTAQHLVLELKDKVAKLAGPGAGFTMNDGPLGQEAKNIADAIQGLMGLGYTASEARRMALAASQALGENSTVEELLKGSLKLTALP